jgi:nicotinate-nucleotide adenylyltransferase
MSSSETENSALSTQHLKLGLLGGTFNPVHNGHLAIARQAREALALDRVILMPTGEPPHKSETQLAPAPDRYEMVRLAIGSDPHLDLSGIEIHRQGKSYSIDTVRQILQEQGPDTDLWFLIGLDAFLEFPAWREPKALLTLCSFGVISRPGASFRALKNLPLLPSLPTKALESLDSDTTSRFEIPLGHRRIVCLKLPPCDISASDIRMKLKKGLSVANLLPPPVESYIIQHHLY